MSLWGKKDGADIWDGSSGQSYTCTSGGVEVEFSGSIASHNPEVGDVLILDDSSVLPLMIIRGTILHKAKNNIQNK